VLVLATKNDARPLRELERDPGARVVYRDRRITVLSR
jgi:hypothetical protein